ncbi:MAG: Immunogenic protein precursor [Parcubacteria group bacterium]|nr:Immunogenic protein precursor [Parcubacteria group bacterium]
MEMNNKHTAVISVGVLVLIFVGLAVWYMATHQAPSAFAPGTATSTASGPVTTAAQPGSIVDTGQYYQIHAQYPASTILAQTASVQADAAAVSVMKSFLQNEAQNFKENGDFANLTPQDIHMQGLDQGRIYTLDATYKMYRGTHTVSYVYMFAADTLGAHPNEYYKTFTFDTTTGDQLAIGDIFQPNSNYFQLLSARVRADLPAMINKIQAGAADTDTINVGTQPITDDFQAWYIDGSSLVILFAPYQVGPYSVGTILDPIPLSTFTNVLKPVYR